MLICADKLADCLLGGGGGGGLMLYMRCIPVRWYWCPLLSGEVERNKTNCEVYPVHNLVLRSVWDIDLGLSYLKKVKLTGSVSSRTDVRTVFKCFTSALLVRRQSITIGSPTKLNRSPYSTWSFRNKMAALRFVFNPSRLSSKGTWSAWLATMTTGGRFCFRWLWQELIELSQCLAWSSCWSLERLTTRRYTLCGCPREKACDGRNSSCPAMSNIR